jgi:hypothetical protein
MSWSVSTKQYIPVQIGEVWGGGYFAGYISHTANGNPTHALIVAPRATGASGTGYTLTTNYAWKTTQTTTANTGSTFDGRVNTDAMIAAGIDNHPAAKFCVDLTIGGYTDWYFPALFELDIAYFNLKPDATPNATSGVNSTFGINPYSVPRRFIKNTSFYPTQTPLSSFAGITQGFVASIHTTSTEVNGITVWSYFFDSGRGYYQSGSKGGSNPVRAFRRVSLSGYTTI